MVPVETFDNDRKFCFILKSVKFLLIIDIKINTFSISIKLLTYENELLFLYGLLALGANC